MNCTKPNLRILIRGANDVGSVVAHRLFQAGFAVVIHKSTLPATIRRRMAFADAVQS
jgi:xanthine dehydrogenase accessory factor